MNDLQEKEQIKTDKKISYHKEYYKQNKTAINNQQKAYYEANKEAIKLRKSIKKMNSKT